MSFLHIYATSDTRRVVAVQVGGQPPEGGRLLATVDAVEWISEHWYKLRPADKPKPVSVQKLIMQALERQPMTIFDLQKHLGIELSSVKSGISKLRQRNAIYVHSYDGSINRRLYAPGNQSQDAQYVGPQSKPKAKNPPKSDQMIADALDKLKSSKKVGNPFAGLLK